MTILRAADIPPNELYLLPVTDLHRQIQEDGNRPSPPNSRANKGELDGSRLRRTLDAEVPAAGLWPAAGESFVTDWQMQDEIRPGSRFPLDRKDTDEEPSDDEDFDDSEDEDAGDENGWRDVGGRLATVS
jgi:hypothetical protein